MNDNVRRALAVFVAITLVVGMVPYASVQLGKPGVSPVGTVSAQSGNTTVGTADLKWTTDEHIVMDSRSVNTEDNEIYVMNDTDRQETTVIDTDDGSVIRRDVMLDGWGVGSEAAPVHRDGDDSYYKAMDANQDDQALDKDDARVYGFYTKNGSADISSAFGYDNDMQPVPRPPAIGPEKVYFGTDGTNSPIRYTSIWKSNGSTDFNSAPSEWPCCDNNGFIYYSSAEDAVYAGGFSSDLYKMDPDSASVTWTNKDRSWSAGTTLDGYYYSGNGSHAYRVAPDNSSYDTVNVTYDGQDGNPGRATSIGDYVFYHVDIGSNDYVVGYTADLSTKVFAMNTSSYDTAAMGYIAGAEENGQKVLYVGNNKLLKFEITLNTPSSGGSSSTSTPDGQYVQPFKLESHNESFFNPQLSTLTAYYFEFNEQQRLEDIVDNGEWVEEDSDEFGVGDQARLEVVDEKVYRLEVVSSDGDTAIRDGWTADKSACGEVPEPPDCTVTIVIDDPYAGSEDPAVDKDWELGDGDCDTERGEPLVSEDCDTGGDGDDDTPETVTPPTDHPTPLPTKTPTPLPTVTPPPGEETSTPLPTITPTPGSVDVYGIHTDPNPYVGGTFLVTVQAWNPGDDGAAKTLDVTANGEVIGSVTFNMESQSLASKSIDWTPSESGEVELAAGDETRNVTVDPEETPTETPGPDETPTATLTPMPTATPPPTATPFPTVTPPPGYESPTKLPTRTPDDGVGDDPYLDTGIFNFPGDGRCVGLRYYDPSYETDSITWDFEVLNTTYTGSKEFEEPVGYFETCLDPLGTENGSEIPEDADSSDIPGEVNITFDRNGRTFGSEFAFGGGGSEFSSSGEDGGAVFGDFSEGSGGGGGGGGGSTLWWVGGGGAVLAYIFREDIAKYVKNFRQG